MLRRVLLIMSVWGLVTVCAVLYPAAWDAWSVVVFMGRCSVIAGVASVVVAEKDSWYIEC
jgi:hypothetical protein